MLWNLESYHFINNPINLDPSCKTSRILELFCLKPDEEETVALLSYSQINKFKPKKNKKKREMNSHKPNGFFQIPSYIYIAECFVRR